MSRMKLLWITKINFKDLFLNLINIFTSPNPNLDPTKIYTGTSKFNPKLHIYRSRELPKPFLAQNHTTSSKVLEYLALILWGHFGNSY